MKAIQNESLARTNNAVPISRTEASFAFEKPIHLQSQFPIMLTYACTIHRVQGLTLKKICVSFDLNKQKTFGNGQNYVALSRAKNMKGIFVSGKVEKSKIKADQDALDENEKLRKEASFSNQVIFVTSFQIHYYYY